MSFSTAVQNAYSRIGRWFLSRGANEDAWLSGQDIGWSSPSATGIAISQQTALACAAVMACVSILAEDVSKLRPRLWRDRMKVEGGRTIKAGGRDPATDHYLHRFMRKPNGWQTWTRFCSQMMIGLVLRGNAYAVIVRDRGGLPVMLVPINPDFVHLWQAPDGSLFWMVTRNGLHQMAMLRNVPMLVPFRDMLHLMGVSSNGLVGLSKIAMNREAIALALAQEQQAARWMGNAARPSGVLTTDQKMTPDAFERSKQSWQQAQTGLMNSGKTAMLEMGLKWQPLSMTSQDIEFIASRTFQLYEIARMFRVPPHMIGEVARGTNSSITQQSQEYFNTTLSTYTNEWKEQLEFTFDLDEDGVYVEFDRSILLEGDIQARFNVYRLGTAAKVLSTNECRDREGYGPAPEGDDVPYGDRVYHQTNMVPLGTEFGGNTDAGLGSDAGGMNPGAGAPNADDPDSDQEVRHADMAARLADLEQMVADMRAQMERAAYQVQGRGKSQAHGQAENKAQS